MPTHEGMVSLGRADELRGPGPFSVQAGSEELVLVRTEGGAFRAFEGRCPHQGALLGEGELAGGELVCRNHRWRFDAVTGRRRGGPECLRSCPVEMREGQLYARPGALAEAAAGRVALRRVGDLPGPLGLPLLGAPAVLDLERLHATLERWAERYGPVYRASIGPHRSVVVSDPALIQTCLRERPAVYRRLGNIEPIFRELGIDGVFSAEGADWRPLRRLAVEALAPGHLRTFYPTLRRVAERLRRRWDGAAEAGRSVDVEEDFKRFTVDVTTQLALGHDLNTLEQDGDVLQRRLEHVFPGITRRLFATVPLWRLVKLGAERRLEAAVAEVFALLRELLGRARARLAALGTSPAPATFLEAMILAHDQEGRPFSEAQILGNAIQMLVAGEDTTALTLSWAVHELCDAPETVRALQEEADAVLGEAPAPVDFESAAGLEVAGAVAQETMRLRPVAPLIFVEANVATVLGDLDLDRGQRICLLMRPEALSPERFSDPGAFRPGRWLQSPPPGAHDPGALMPFGSGPRLCPGRALALLEMKVVLATLARAFDLERVGERRRVAERFAFTMGPRGLEVRLRPRLRTAPGWMVRA